MKTCTKCNVSKAFEEFCKNTQQSSGLHPSCKSCKNLYDRRRHIENPARHNDRSRRLRVTHRKQLNEYKAKYQRKHKAYYAQKQSERRYAQRQATPAWLSTDQRREIRSIYEAARRRSAETGVPHCVDHVVPILGRDVCGLHVPWNLRVTTVSENSEKHNRLIIC